MTQKKMSISVSLRPAVNAALTAAATAENKDLTDYVTDILERHALDGPFMTEQDKSDLELLHSLTERVVETAVRLVAEGQFRDSITADSIAICEQDEKWLADYRKYVRDEPYKNGNPRKGNINPNFGYWVKKSLGAKSKMKDKKAENRKVLGSVIQSYTPLEL
ncbi:hypothetical protein [Blastomonas fulva]|jgi:hypothetical protein|uniref:hypothetical protein n=1 Tax=Blastomonas fulva TaxID=1550728 RepID=UPI0024E21DAD|nr:hypothetical protein [Blastomonas fulva]MDK2756813.1 hypothetical protein [Blastomonas fulva]MDM7929663.1 hypothetical protein [Blastomonas fulva]MDM7965529.1 hypothetical protein [Blastomonas fulva]